MAVAIPNGGTYTVEMDFGSSTNQFILDSELAGVLDGTVYVLDGEAKVLDERAILGVNDLGVLGRTWSQNAVAWDGKRLYHRTAKVLLAIGR